MGAEPLRGFVLEQVQLSDHRFVVQLFSQCSGRRKGVFRMSKQQPQALLTPLSLWRCQLQGREHQELKTIAQVNLESHCYDVGTSYLGLNLLHHMAKLLVWSQPEGQVDERVFRLVNHVLGLLRSQSMAQLAQPGFLPAVHAYFEIWLLHFAGVLPRPAHKADPSIAVTQESKIGQQLPTSLLCATFERTVEDFTSDALQLGSLSQAHQTLGKFWEHFLSRELKTRNLLTRQFQERRLW